MDTANRDTVTVLREFRSDDFRGGLGVQETGANDKFGDDRGTAVVGLRSGFFADERIYALLGEGASDLEVARFAVVEVEGGTDGSDIGAFALNKHGHFQGSQIVFRDRQGP